MQNRTLNPCRQTTGMWTRKTSELPTYTPPTLACTLVWLTACIALVTPGSLLLAQQKNDQKKTDAGIDQLDGLVAAAAIEQVLVKAIADAEPSVVAIARYTAKEEREFRGRFPRWPIPDPNEDGPYVIPADFGSGVIIAKGAKNPSERYILTNYHVVKGVVENDQTTKLIERWAVRLLNKEAVEAEVVGADPRSDLAVLKIDVSKLNLKDGEAKPIHLGDGTKLRKGQIVVALGNPYAIGRDGSPSASWGMISNIGRRPQPLPYREFTGPPENETIHHFGTLLHVDTRLNVGTSGGALLNLKGELVGLTTSLAALEGYEKSVGFAVPMDEDMKRIVEQLIKGQEVEFGMLGVRPGTQRFRGGGRWWGPPRQMQPPNQPPKLGQPSGAKVANVSQGSPASLAGIEDDDVIVAVNDTRVYDGGDLLRLVGLAGAGNIIQVTVVRAGATEPLVFDVKLGKWPVYDDSRLVVTSKRFEPWRGIEVDYSTGRWRFLPSALFQFPPGVVVTSVAPGSLAEQAGLTPGMFIASVNGESITSPRNFYDLVLAAGSGDSVSLTPWTRADGEQAPLLVQGK